MPEDLPDTHEPTEALPPELTPDDTKGASSGSILERLTSRIARSLPPGIRALLVKESERPKRPIDQEHPDAELLALLRGNEWGTVQISHLSDVIDAHQKLLNKIRISAHLENRRITFARPGAHYLPAPELELLAKYLTRFARTNAVVEFYSGSDEFMARYPNQEFMARARENYQQQ